MDTKSVIVKALTIDASKLASKPDKYIKANEFQYSLAIDTWFSHIKEISGEKAVVAVSFEVIRLGLVATIDAASSVSNLLIRGEDVTTLPAVWCWVCKDLTLRDALQVLRYLKRFTPIGCDLLDEASIGNYVDTLNRNKMKDRKGYSQYILSWVKPILQSLVSGIDFGQEMPNGIPLSFYEHGYFSSGVTWDAVPNSKARKMEAWKSPYFGDVSYPLLHTTSLCPYYWSNSIFHKAEAKCVPKNYKTKRLIAEEESERQFYMQGMREIVREHISSSPYIKNLELDRQESQQRRCFNPEWATIDMHAASDSIAAGFAYEVVPQDLLRYVDRLRATYVTVNGKQYLNTIYQTSGSAWCFDGESHIFYAICDGCQKWKSTFTGETYLPVFVYGDDIEVDVRCFAECIEWLETLGFKVNEDKSFGSDTLYRESCGVEVLDGYEVSSSYWPRKEVSRSKESLETLISLSDRLLSVGWIEAHMLVLNEIQNIAGSKFTTTSVLDSGYSTDPRTVVTPITIPVTSRRVYSGDDPRPEYEGHMCVTQVTSENVSSYTPIDMDMYYYTQFLMHGPRYEDPLSKLLKVSSSYRQKDDTRCNMRVSLSVRPLI